MTDDEYVYPPTKWGESVAAVALDQLHRASYKPVETATLDEVMQLRLQVMDARLDAMQAEIVRMLMVWENLHG